MTEQASIHDRGRLTIEASLRNAPPQIVAKVNRARRQVGLPEIDLPAGRDDRGGGSGPGVVWDPRSPHRPRGGGLVVGSRLPAPPALATRVLLMPVLMDASARNVGRSLPEAIAPGAFGAAADLNRGGRWCLRSDHTGPVFDYAGPRLRAIDTAHGLAVEWLPDLRLPWARDAVGAIEAGRNACSVSMVIHERRIAHLPHPVELIARATIEHIALLLEPGDRGCYPGARSVVFRNCRPDDPGQLSEQLRALYSTCARHAREAGARC
jgi:hypothetical protein